MGHLLIFNLEKVTFNLFDGSTKEEFLDNILVTFLVFNYRNSFVKSILNHLSFHMYQEFKIIFQI